VLDNPVRKDRVFGVPYMSAASWKGLLRWAFHMHTGLVGPARERDERRTAVARAASVHLFGNEKGAEDDFQRGALVFYPTWFSKLDFEVINPHKRATRAGHQPILYEVVPADTPGILRLLYAPLTSRMPEQAPGAAVILEQLLDAAEQLLTLYGFSAKRTAGWSVAAIERVRAASHESELSGTLPEIKAALGRLLPDVEARV
jgi:CRISPR-associated protein Cmr2